jgi:hypothetical protein
MAKDAYVEKLDLAVQDARLSISRKRGYMNYVDEMKHERWEGREEGLAEGCEEGRAEECVNTERERKRAEEAENRLSESETRIKELEAELESLRR